MQTAPTELTHNPTHYLIRKEVDAAAGGKVRVHAKSLKINVRNLSFAAPPSSLFAVHFPAIHGSQPPTAELVWIAPAAASCCLLPVDVGFSRFCLTVDADPLFDCVCCRQAPHQAQSA